MKRALPKLRVAADWRAPALLGQGEATGTLAMEWLPPERHPLWKAQLRDGYADPGFAAEVGRRLARIHAASALFPTDDIFHALRLEPYLLAAARAHPDLAMPLEDLTVRTAATRLTLVHGDVSPKNILAGPRGPVFLDAECAWWGDPAFDLAFCLNHLLLKCLWTPPARAGFLACFDALAQAYLAGVAWEPPAALEGRTATLLPGLFLARVDGKNPVEYLTAEADRDKVRRTARALLLSTPVQLRDIRTAWEEELER